MKNTELPYPEVTKSSYRLDIDGLRGLQILALLGFHGFPSRVPGGYIGVSIFFVISGYLITSIMLKSFDKNTFDFLDFYTRRIRRIFPSLIVILTATILLGWVLMLPVEYEDLGTYILGGAGFYDNFVALGQAGYFDKSSEFKPLLHLWSLGIEEQFYLFWPALLWGAWKLRFNLFVTIVIAVTFSFICNVVFINSSESFAFFSPFTRMWEILSGGILAYAHINGLSHRCTQNIDRWSPQALQNASGFIGFFLLICGIFLLDSKIKYPGWYALIPVLGATLLIAAGQKSWVNQKILSHRIIVWFGLISYPLYLWHWLLLSFTRVFYGGESPAEVRSLAIIFSIFLSWVTYKWIENPFRFGGFVKLKVWSLIFTLSIIAYVGNFIYSNNGFPDRLNLVNLDNNYRQFQKEPWGSLKNENCTNKFLNSSEFDVCLLSKGDAPEVLILGDSHSLHYYQSFSENLENFSVMNVASWNCLPFASNAYSENNRCLDRQKKILEFIEQNESIKTIYLAGYWDYLIAGKLEFYPSWRHASKLSQNSIDLFERNAKEFLDKVFALQVKRNIILISDIPDLNFNIQSCFYLRPNQLQINKSCRMEKNHYEKRHEDYLNVISRLKKNYYHEMKIYDPTNLFCDEKFCYGKINGTALYFNSDHLSKFGADLVASDLFSIGKPQK